MICDRCGQECWGWITSMFNTETICFTCKDLETEHPQYAAAVDADVAAIEAGDYNFLGIGLPPELRKEKRCPQ